MSGMWRAIISLAVIQGVFALIYVPAWQYEFVWDDVASIRDNPLMTGPVEDGLRATQHDHMDQNLANLKNVRVAHESYRPLLYLSYRLDHLLSSNLAPRMHLHNILIASVNIWLVGLLLLWWFSSVPMAAFGAALFAFHPIQVESITYISGRGDLLAAMWALLSLACVSIRPKAEANVVRAILAALFFLFSLLSKEAYLALPVCLALLWGWSRPRKVSWVYPLTLLGVLLAYLVWRSVALGRGGEGDAFQALLLLPGIWLHYLRILLVPFGFSIERLHQPGFTGPGIVVLLLWTAGAVLVFAKSKRLLPRALFSGLLVMLLLIGPSALVVEIQGVLADRYMYLPMLGFVVTAIVAVKSLVDSWPRFKILVITAVTCILLGYIAIAALQRLTWRDNRTLYTHSVLTEPDSSMAHYRLGYSLAVEGRMQEALPFFQNAVALDPANIRALNNLGAGYMQLGQFEAAKAPLRLAIERSNNTSYRAWYNLSQCQRHLGELNAACASLSNALKISPGYGRAREAWQTNCTQESNRDE